MSSIPELLKQCSDEILRCTRCGFCQAACPTFEVLRRESFTSRGKVQLIRAVSQGEVPLSAAVARYVFTCLDCRSCLQHCPGGVRTNEIFALARRALAQTPFFPPPLTEMKHRVARQHNISGEDNANRLLWQDNLENNRSSTATARPEVIYFVGCVASLYPMVYAIPQSFVNILTSAEVTYRLLGGEEWCCGYPLMVAGHDFGDLMAHNMAEIQRLGAKCLVTTCPSCYYTWQNYYPHGELKILHATQYLAALIDHGRLKLGAISARVTYHDPCDLGRKSQEYESARRVLLAIPGIELIEMDNNRTNALCCGGGGNLETLNPELSNAIAAQRLMEAQHTGASIIVSSCQQCERTLTMAARRAKARIKVMDLTELVHRSLQATV